MARMSCFSHASYFMLHVSSLLQDRQGGGAMAISKNGRLRLRRHC